MELFWQIMQHAVDFVRAVINISPESINQYATALGPWLYVVLFAIIFAETGLVVTPFLPGDSLLFAVGAIAAGAESPIHLGLVALLLLYEHSLVTPHNLTRVNQAFFNVNAVVSLGLLVIVLLQLYLAPP